MKTRYGYIGALIAACLLQACESDLDKAYYSDGKAVPAVLESLPATFNIDKLQQDEVALTFKWSAPEVGYNASITNNLEMDMKGSKNFGDKKVILSSTVGKNSTATFTHKELNDQVLALLANYADEAGVYAIGDANLEFRITSTVSSAKSALVSNIVSSTITPYDNENTGYEAAKITSTVESSLALSADKKEETAIALAWQKAYLGDNATINYAIEMNLPNTAADYNWSKKVVVATTKETSFDLTNKALNDALISLLTKYGKAVAPTEIALTVSATKNGYVKAQVSTPVAITITPYVAVAPALTVPESMDLTSDNTYSLTWEAVEGASYQVEMDVKDASFSQRAILATGLNEASLTIDNAAMSKAIKYLKIAHSMVTRSAGQEIDLRVRAYFGNTETGVLSETKSVAVTYDDSEVSPAVFYLIGKYSEWDHGKSQKLYNREGTLYIGHIVAYNLAGSNPKDDGWKITDQPDWEGRNWGAPILKDDVLTIYSQDNIISYGKDGNTSYTVEFNPDNGVLNMSNEEKSWMLLGDHNNHAFGDDSKMTIVNEGNKWYLQKKDVKMQAGNTWQIRSQMLNMEVTPQNVEGHFETCATDIEKFTVSQTGTYEVRWYFNEPTPCVIVIKE